MSPKEKAAASTRRSFLKRGALLAAPLAAVAAPAAILVDDELRARLARLENEAAIRELHQAWLRRINAGAGDAAMLDPSVSGIAPDHSAEPDAIEVAADGKHAAGRFYCAVETATEIPQDSTLGQMARAQGSGFLRRTERRMLKVEYAKTSGVWEIAKAELAPA